MQVLFATDGTESSNTASAMLEALGDRETIDVTVLSVSPFKEKGAGSPLVPPEMMSDVQDHVRNVVDAATSRLQDAKFKVTGRVEEGDSKKRIVESAASGEFDLVVVGAGQHSWFGKLLMGSTSMHVLQQSPASVLVVHEMRRRPEPVRVLVASDGSEVAQGAAEQLRQLADSTKCEVTVLSVADTASQLLPPISQPGGDLEGASRVQGYLADEVKQSEDAARSVTEAEAAKFRAAGFSVDEELAVGGPAGRAILEESQEQGYDLVVVGYSGQGGLGASVLGSVADAVARNTRAALVGREAGSAKAQNGSASRRL